VVILGGSTILGVAGVPTTLVLGAGSSLANALHFHAVRNTRKNPPLDVNFFAKINDLGIDVPTDLRKWASTEAALDPFDANGPPVRMEEFFKELFGEFQDTSGPNITTRAYTELVKIYARVLRDTTNWLCADSRSGSPIGKLLQCLADGTDDLSVITFNHDLVIENEIHKRAKLRKRWCLQQGYGQHFAALTYTNPSGGTAPLFEAHTNPGCDHSKPIRVFKLHGSLNWYVRLRGGSPTRNVLSGSGSNAKIHVTRRRTIDDQFTISANRTSRSSRGRTSFNTWPVIVPPVHEKDAIIRSNLKEVWQEARLALGQSDRIVFCGYSLPLLDTGAERLFQRAIATSSDLSKVEVIDPQPAVGTRYATLAPKRPMHWYPSVESFLDAQASGV
jgi:hypothetical protein